MTQTSQLQPLRGSGGPANRSVSNPRSSAQRHRSRIELIARPAAALVFAGLAPALAMIALWPTAGLAPIVFILTFVIALAHAVVVGLPLFLVFQSKGWINIMTCIVVGFAIGAVPDGILTSPMQHPELHAVSVHSVPTITNGVLIAAAWVGYVKPVIYCGSLGALGGLVFWVVLT